MPTHLDDAYKAKVEAETVTHDATNTAEATANKTAWDAKWAQE